MATEIKNSEMNKVYGTAYYAGLDGPPNPAVVTGIINEQKRVEHEVEEFRKRAPFSSVLSALQLAEEPIRPHHINFDQAVITIARGLKYALEVKPSLKIMPLVEVPPLETTKPDHDRSTRKFMTLDDVHTAASRQRELVAAQ